MGEVSKINLPLQAGGYRLANSKATLFPISDEIYQCPKMDYQFRIPVDEQYLLAIGRATYNFTYLEKVIVDIIAKIGNSEHNSIPAKATAGTICKRLEQLIPTSDPHIRSELVSIHSSFKNAIDINRNKLLHAHPYTSIDGEQQIGYPDKEWTVELIYQVAKEFELIAIESSKLYYDKIVKLPQR